MLNSPDPEQESKIYTSSELLEKGGRPDVLIQNVRQVEVRVPVDRIQLCLIRHLERSKARWGEVLSILALALTLVVTLETVKTFQPWMGVSAETWKAWDQGGLVLCVIFLIIFSYRALRSPTKDQVIRDIVDELQLIEHTNLRWWQKLWKCIRY